MRTPWYLGVLCLGLLAGGAAAADPPTPAKAPALLDAQALAARIDAHIQAKWAQSRVTPGQRAEDAEFLRRVSLDIIGRIPTVHELHTFLDDKSPDKRQKLVARMLDSHGYVGNFTNVWRDLIVPQSTNNMFAAAFGQQMEAWL